MASEDINKGVEFDYQKPFCSRETLLEKQKK